MKTAASPKPRFSTWVITLMTLAAMLVTMTLLGCHYENCYYCYDEYDVYSGQGEHRLCPWCEKGGLCVGKHGKGICDARVCPGCHEPITQENNHMTECSQTNHYSCIGIYGPRHDRCEACRHEYCNTNQHTLLECGHYECQSEKAESHILPCGHFACEEGDHKALSCGEDHFACDGQDHTALDCGHCVADTERKHNEKLCGHYACEEGNHTLLLCGHYACDGRNHVRMDCGHWGCQNLMTCGHCSACSGTEGHGTCPICLERMCQSSRDHGVSNCGHYVCESIYEAGHVICELCGVCTSLGGHGVGVCPSFPCGFCGVNTVTEGEHVAACGLADHYNCDQGDHTLCSRCNTYFCEGWHFTWECGHVMCEKALDDGLHTQLPCGHWSHNGTPLDGADHTAMMPCGSHHVCVDGDNPDWHTPKECGHAPCAACGCA